MADMNKQLESIFKDFAENLDLNNLENIDGAITFGNIDDEEVYIDFGTSISPCIVRSVEEDGDYKYMILPIRLKNE